jgi:hypothetical protein
MPITHEAECDFVSGGLLLELGGGKKRTKDADYVIRDNTDLPTGNILPMWMLGLGY